MSVLTSPSTTKSVVSSFTSVKPLLILTSPPFPGDALTVASDFLHTPPSGAGLSNTPPSGVGDLKYISKCLILVLHDIEILHIDYCGLHSNSISICWVPRVRDTTLPRRQTAFFLQSRVEIEHYSVAYFDRVTVFKAL